MQLTEIAEIILLILLVVCAVGVNFGKSLLQAVIIFMSYSSIMCILWVLLASGVAGPGDHGGGRRSGYQQCAVHADPAKDTHRGSEAGGAAAGGADRQFRRDCRGCHG